MNKPGQRIDELLKKYPDMQLTEALIRAGEDEIVLENLDTKPISRYGPGEDDALLDEPGFREAGVSEDRTEKRFGLCESGMEEEY